MRTVIRASLSFFVCLTPAQAAKPYMDTTALDGIGTETCAAFAQQFKADPANEVIFFHWAQGFMSGQNFVPALTTKPIKVLRSIDAETQKLRIRVYCDKHPLLDYANAVSSVYDAMTTVNK